MRRNFGKLCLIIGILLVIFYFSPFLINEIGYGCTLDDVHPTKIDIKDVESWVKNHECENKIIFVTPLLENESILNYKEWCKDLLDLSERYNFEIGLHGYKHFKFGSDCGEFLLPSSDFFRAYKEYESAFSKKPKIWRSPCFSLNLIDYFFIKSKGMKNYGFVNSGEVYHPNNLNSS